MEHGRVASQRQFYADLAIAASVVLIQFQPAAHVSRLNPHNGIVPGGIVQVATENLCADQPFLEQLFVPVDLLLDDKLQELPGTFAVAEMTALQNAQKLLPDQVWGDCFRL
jgi:hypothetical protein